MKILTESYLNITKKDHVRTTFKHNAFHVNLAAIRPQMLSLESGNCNYYYCY